MADFRKLAVWEKAHQLALHVYRVSAGFPPHEQYGLTSQLRRAATSIPSNIAEGAGRGTDGDFGRFLQMALGSANEVEYQLLLARDLAYLDSDMHQSIEPEVIEIKRMLQGLIAKLRD
jgi:four helix bundle protein